MTDCVIFPGAKDKAGYGYVGWLGKTVLVHRKTYCEANGVTLDSIKGLVVRHTCDTPSCIQPLHLLIGTTQDNVDDKVSRGRQARQFRETNGATKLSVDDVEFICAVYVPRHPEFGTRALGRRYGVTSSTISSAIRKQSIK